MHLHFNLAKLALPSRNPVSLSCRRACSVATVRSHIDCHFKAGRPYVAVMTADCPCAGSLVNEYAYTSLGVRTSPNKMCAYIQASYRSCPSLFQKQARFSTTSKTARIEKLPCRGVESQYGCRSSGGALLNGIAHCWMWHERADSPFLQELKIKTTSTKPIDGQKTGTSGLRKKTNVFTSENYLANWYNTLEFGDLHTGVRTP